jgi:hypothetical protein
MSQRSLFEGLAFGPGEIAVLQSAYDRIEKGLAVGRLSEGAAELIAKKIIAAAKSTRADLDAEKIAAQVAKNLRLPSGVPTGKARGDN